MAILRPGSIEANNNFIQNPLTPEWVVKAVRGTLDQRTECHLT